MLTDKTVADFFNFDKSKIMINEKMLEPVPPIVDYTSPAKILQEILNYFDCVLVEKKGTLYAENLHLCSLDGFYSHHVWLCYNYLWSKPKSPGFY